MPGQDDTVECCGQWLSVPAGMELCFNVQKQCRQVIQGVLLLGVACPSLHLFTRATSGDHDSCKQVEWGQS